MRTRIALWIVFAAVVANPPARCQDKPAKSDKREFHLQWRDLDRATRGYRVALVLPSGIRLQGDPVAFEADDLILDVHKTSDKRAYPKGRSIVPRAEVTRLRVIKTKTTWRIAGTAIGGAVGVGVAVPMLHLADNIAINKGLTGLLSVGIPTGVGFLLGWAADQNVVEIVVEPER